MLLSRSLRGMNHLRCFHAPKSAEEINGPRTEPRVVIVGKGQNHDAPLLDLLEKAHPLGKITLAIYNHLVPRCRFFLDPFPVPNHPTEVKSAVIRSNLFFISHGPGRHPLSIHRKTTTCLPRQLSDLGTTPPSFPTLTP